MNPGRATRRIVGFVIHNWLLKAAAIVVATLLYAGLVASQDSNVYPGPVQVLVADQPSGTVVTNQFRPVEEVRYLAPADAGRLTAEDFRATVNLASLDPTGQPVNVRVDVVPTDPRVTVIDFRPRTIQVILDEKISVTVPVRVARGSVPAGIDAGETSFSPESVSVTGPSAAVKQVVAVRVSIALDPGGIDFDRDVEADPIDAAGERVPGVDVEPRTVHVTVPLFTDKESRTLPVNPVLTGAPAPGFRITGVDPTPLTVSVEGDADQLAQLMQADTAPVAVFGATRNVTVTVALALPPGVAALGNPTITVVVHVAPVTETRTFTAGIRLDGREPGLSYDVAAGPVLLTLFGSVADLDRLASAPLVVGLNVGGLAPGVHEVPVIPLLPAGLSLAVLSPETVTVRIAEPATPAPPSAIPSPSPDPSSSGAGGSAPPSVAP